MNFLLIISILQLFVTSLYAFRPITNNRVVSNTKSNNVNMLFDFLKPKKSATASHILLKGDKVKFLTDLKSKLESSKNVKTEFAEAASKYSTCPSSKNGGSLGTFKQGQMVPAFDKVVFSQKVGGIHGPVTTPFGVHLIYIEGRED